MLVEHAHQPGRFDAGHRFDCARESDLLDHYWKVQREEQAFKEAHRWARAAGADPTARGGNAAAPAAPGRRATAAAPAAQPDRPAQAVRPTLALLTAPPS